MVPNCAKHRSCTLSNMLSPSILLRFPNRPICEYHPCVLWLWCIMGNPIIAAGLNVILIFSLQWKVYVPVFFLKKTRMIDLIRGAIYTIRTNFILKNQRSYVVSLGIIEKAIGPKCNLKSPKARHSLMSRDR